MALSFRSQNLVPFKMSIKFLLTTSSEAVLLCVITSEFFRFMTATSSFGVKPECAG